MKNTFLLAFSLFWLSVNAQTTPEKTAQMNRPIGGEFAHVVLFWLKNPDNPDERSRFEASLGKFIKSSEFVRSMHLGTPAGTNRPVIDASYTYCMIVTFSSKEDQDKYQEEPAHKQFIAESQDLWEKVTVFDSVNLW